MGLMQIHACLRFFLHIFELSVHVRALLGAHHNKDEVVAAAAFLRQRYVQPVPRHAKGPTGSLMSCIYSIDNIEYRMWWCKL